MRNAFHVTVSLLMWCLFGYYWFVVARRQITTASLVSLGVLGCVIFLVLAITFWWVAHNKKLARRNRRTTPPRTTPETFAADYLGRPLVRPEIAQLKKARIIDIDLAPNETGDTNDLGRKIYAIGGKEGL